MLNALVQATHPARVAHATLRQHQLLTFDDTQTLVLLSAFGMPRLWGFALDAAARGLHEGFARPHDGRASTRLHQALDGAQQALRRRVDALIERKLPDVALLALTLTEESVHVLCVGPQRAYLRHGLSTRRLTPKDERAEGILKASPAFCTEPVKAGDMIVGGSLSAFGEPSRSALAQMFSSHFRADPVEIVRALNTPAAEAGVGVAAFAVPL